jgi:ribonuclease R
LESNKSIRKPGEHDTEIHAILAEYGLPLNFRLKKPCPKKLILNRESEIANRRDMRDTLTLLLIQKMLKILMMLYHLKIRNGNYEIGIHIADVSYYLEEEVFLMTKRIKELICIFSR